MQLEFEILYRPTIVGSCNGLVCIIAYTRKYQRRPILVIWNPATRCSRKITIPKGEKKIEKLSQFIMILLQITMKFLVHVWVLVIMLIFMCSLGILGTGKELVF